MTARSLSVSFVLLLACGPKPGDTGAASESGGTTGGATTTAAPSTTTTTADATTTTTPTTTTTTATTGPVLTGSAGTTASAPDVPPQDCDFFAQDCPAGFKCNAYATDGTQWNAYGCFPLAPDPVAPGEACTAENSVLDGIDDCEAGAMCWSVDQQTKQGMCVAFCDGGWSDPTCPDVATQCHISRLFALCLPICDPVAQDCAAGEQCQWLNSEFGCVADTEDLGLFAGCEYVNQCAAGHLCGAKDFAPADCPPDATGCCLPYCDVNAANTCPGADLECRPFFEDDPPPQHAHVGVCAVPK